MCINLNLLATPLTIMVNPLTNAVLRRQHIFNPARDVQPDGSVNNVSYDDYQVEVDVQALDSSDLQLVNNVQQQSDGRRVFIFGDVRALNRPLQTGADYLIFRGALWLITIVKQWDSGQDWAEVLVTRQIETRQIDD